MKRALFCITGVFLACTLYSQTVENIRVEPEGENIKINYRIGGSTDAQLYNVYLTCSMDGGPRFEPRSVIGDVGQNIRGGRSFYTVIWDVFEDVELVGNAEFFVRVELVSDAAAPLVNQPREQPEEAERQIQEPVAANQQVTQPPSNKQTNETGRVDTSPFDPAFETTEKKQMGAFERYLYISYSGSQLNPVGISFGTLRKWGVYGSIRLGKYNELYELMEGSVTAGLTKSVVNLGVYRLHGYVGAGIGDFFDTFDVEAGVSNVLFNRLKLSVGLEYPGYYASFVYGIGLIF